MKKQNVFKAANFLNESSEGVPPNCVITFLCDDEFNGSPKLVISGFGNKAFTLNNDDFKLMIFALSQVCEALENNQSFSPRFPVTRSLYLEITELKSTKPNNPGEVIGGVVTLISGKTGKVIPLARSVNRNEYHLELKEKIEEIIDWINKCSKEYRTSGSKNIPSLSVTRSVSNRIIGELAYIHPNGGFWITVKKKAMSNGYARYSISDALVMASWIDKGEVLNGIKKGLQELRDKIVTPDMTRKYTISDEKDQYVKFFSPYGSPIPHVKINIDYHAFCSSFTFSAGPGNERIDGLINAIERLIKD